MAIIAQLKDQNRTEVEIVDTFVSTGGRRFLVKATRGEPFLSFGYGGGWYSTAYATVSRGEIVIPSVQTNSIQVKEAQR